MKKTKIELHADLEHGISLLASMIAEKLYKEIKGSREIENKAVPNIKNDHKVSNEIRVIREKEVVKLVGLSRTTIWRMEQKGDFPKRRKLSANSTGWISSEIYKWIETR